MATRLLGSALSAAVDTSLTAYRAGLERAQSAYADRRSRVDSWMDRLKDQWDTKMTVYTSAVAIVAVKSLAWASGLSVAGLVAWYFKDWVHRLVQTLKDNKAMRKQIGNLTAQVDRLNPEVTRITAEREGFAEENRKLKDLTEQQGQQLEGFQTVQTELKEVQQKLDIATGNMDDRGRELHKQLLELVRDIATREETLRQLDIRLAGRTEELTALTKNYESVQQLLSQHVTHLQGINATDGTLQTQLEEQIARFQELVTSHLANTVASSQTSEDESL